MLVHGFAYVHRIAIWIDWMTGCDMILNSKEVINVNSLSFRVAVLRLRPMREEYLRWKLQSLPGLIKSQARSLAIPRVLQLFLQYLLVLACGITTFRTSS